MLDESRGAEVSPRGVNPEDDPPRLAALFAAVAAVDGAGDDMSEAAIRDMLAWPGHDPRQDRWVVEEPRQPGRLIAHGLVWKGAQDPYAEVDVTVHPDWRRRGLGGALLAPAIERARTLGAVAARAYGNERHPAAAPFLRRHGFAPVAAYTEMRCRAERIPAAPAFPDGYRVRAYADVGDPTLLARAMTDAYGDLWGHHPVSAEDLASWLPAWRPDGIFLLFDARADVAGLCRAEVRAAPAGTTQSGYVNAPGVVPARRADDLYVPLLLTAMRWLHAQGIRAIALESWGDDEGTLGRYRALGFAVTRRAISYRIEL